MRWILMARHTTVSSYFKRVQKFDFSSREWSSCCHFRVPSYFLARIFYAISFDNVVTTMLSIDPIAVYLKKSSRYANVS